MPAGAGKIICLATMILPKIRSLVKLKVIAFGNGDARPVIRRSPDSPSLAGF
jgi:hypothetical protein